MDIKLGDNLVFKRDGLLALVLGAVLKRFEPSWDGWGWHVAPVVQVSPEVKVLNAEAGGCKVRPLREVGSDYRVYRFLPQEPGQIAVDDFCRDREGCPYDSLIYVLTVVQYLGLRFSAWITRFLPWTKPFLGYLTSIRLMDSAWSCWEVTEEFDDEFGRSWPYTHEVPHRYPLLSDFLKVAGPPIPQD